MNRTDQYRLRIQNCVGTILDVHSTISKKFENQELLSQFEGLEEAIDTLDMSLVSEGDILMVEQATNALLDEFRALSVHQGEHPVQVARGASAGLESGGYVRRCLGDRRGCTRVDLHSDAPHAIGVHFDNEQVPRGSEGQPHGYVETHGLTVRLA